MPSIDVFIFITVIYFLPLIAKHPLCIVVVINLWTDNNNEDVV